jgi:hypothetical protein
MKKFQIGLVLLIILAALIGVAFADLPDLPKQELWVKIVSLIVGLIVVFAISVMGINKLLYSVLNMDADQATKISIVIGIIFSFLWFLYLFGQIFNMTITIAVGALVVITLIVYFMRGSE